MLQIFCAPSRYVQGRDATRALGAEIAKMGLPQPVVIIAGKSAQAELAPMWTETFGMQGLKFHVVPFGKECSTAEITRLSQAALDLRAGTIVGAGGGKVLDAARAVASQLNRPIVSCPTVAASDAPCSAVSVVYSEEGVFERALVYKKNPDLVLVDSSVIARAPARYLVSGMGDALATWFEADTSHRAGRATILGGAPTRAAMTLARLCYQTLLDDGPSAVAAVTHQAVTPALERIIEANTLLSGLGFESGGLAVAHSIHNGLTAIPATHAHMHGEKVAFGTIVQLVLEGRDRQEIDQVLGFCQKVGLPITLKEVGIERLSDEEARCIAERAIAPGETAHNVPFALTWQGVRDALRTADALGRGFHQGHTGIPLT